MKICALCHRGFQDNVGIVQIVEGEYEADTGGMATHGATDSFHFACWNTIVYRLSLHGINLERIK